MGHGVCKWCDEFENYKKWLKAIEPELKSIRATTGSVAVVRSVLIKQMGFQGKILSWF